MKPLVIDAHHHLWHLDGALNYGWLDNPGLEPIRRDFGAKDLHSLLQAAGVDRSIFVQTLADSNETRWALAEAERYPFLAGVVGWVDLASPDCQRQVEEFRSNPRFIGVRHVVHDEPDVDFIVRPAILRGLRVLEAARVPFDLLFRPAHLHHVPTLARACPDLPMVLDHLAKPEIRSGRLDGWIEPFRAAGRCPNVLCKLSGMITEADHQSWTVADLRPHVEIALDVFGPDRLMFGSDWPVCELAGSYDQAIEAVRELTGHLSPSETTAIFGATAARFYGLTALG